MWSDDRRYHDRRLRETQDELTHLGERLILQERELADDDYDGTVDSRARLSEARAALAALNLAITLAWEQLPNGEQRPPLPSL